MPRVLWSQTRPGGRVRETSSSLPVCTTDPSQPKKNAERARERDLTHPVLLSRGAMVRERASQQPHGRKGEMMNARRPTLVALPGHLGGTRYPAAYETSSFELQEGIAGTKDE